MSHWWSNPDFWMYLTLGIGAFFLILAPYQASPWQKRDFYSVCRVSLSVTVTLAGVFRANGYVTPLVLIVGLLAIWGGGWFLKDLRRDHAYVSQNGEEEKAPETPRAQAHS